MIFDFLTKAKDLFYNNKSSGLNSANVQGALDELASGVKSSVKKTDTTVYAGDKVYIRTDNEGGNVGIYSPDGGRWEIDANNGNLRIFRYSTDTEGQITYWLQKDGKLVVPDVIYSKGSKVITRGDTELNLVQKIGMNYNSEGGNIWWYAPDGSQWEIDACEGTQARIFRYNPDGTHTFFHFNAVNKSIGINGVTVAKAGITVWKNSNPTEGIQSELTISIDFSQYTEFEIQYCDLKHNGTTKTVANIQRTGKIPVSDIYMLIQSVKGVNGDPQGYGYREYQVVSGSEGKIVFSEGYMVDLDGTYSEGCPYYAIPLKIICY